MLEEFLQDRVRPRSNRRNTRGVKGKMSGYQTRRKAEPAMPDCDITGAI